MSVDDNKGSIRYLFVFYSIPIRPNVKNDRHKGTKKVCETSDMLRDKHVFSHRIERIKRMQDASSSKRNQNP